MQGVRILTFAGILQGRIADLDHQAEDRALHSVEGLFSLNFHNLFVEV